MVESSPSGIHMGHYKAICLSDKLSRLCARLILTPFVFGFSAKKWKVSLHQMIEKNPGSPNIERLRIIQLLKEDLNIYLKVKVGREMMRIAEKSRLFRKDIHGGRKNKSTTDSLLTQILTHDITRTREIPISSLSLDSRKCFDKIPTNLASICLTKLGLPKSIGTSIEKSVLNMRHMI